jgi:hypothetical protein
MYLRSLAAAVVLAALIAGAAGCGNPPTAPTAPTTLTVSAISPNSGTTFGGTVVELLGTGFQSGITVHFGTQSAVVTSLTNNSTGSKLSVLSPPNAEGMVDVVVTNPGGAEVRLERAFRVVGFRIASVSPKQGLPLDFATVSGTGFRSGDRVEIGGVSAPIRSITDGTMDVIVPQQCRPGVVDVTVTDVTGAAVTLPQAFTCQTVQLTPDVTAVAAAGPLVLSWLVPRDPSSDYAFDQIRLVRAGGDPDVFVWDIEVHDRQGTAALAAPAAPGEYEFCYLLFGVYVIAKSAVVVVR